MSRLLPGLAACCAAALAACSSTPASSPAPSSASSVGPTASAGSSPAAIASPKTPGAVTTQGIPFAGLTLLVDGQSAPIAPVLVANVQGASGATSSAYVLGLVSGQPLAQGSWTVTVTYAKAAQGTNFGATISQRTGTALTALTSYSFLSALGPTGTALFSTPALAVGTATEAQGKLDVHVSGTFSALAGSATHQLELRASGLPL